MKLVNLTPHSLEFPGNNIIPSQGLARAELIDDVGYFQGIKIINRKFGQTNGLPMPQENTYYIVSTIVALANPDRDDLMVPSHPVYDDRGNITCTKTLIRNIKES